MLILLATVQFILHYLGWTGVLLGIVAFVFGNNERGGQLLIGGVSFIALKYLVGIIVLTPLRIAASRKESQDAEHLLDDRKAP